MARRHLLEGLMNWTTREPWRDRFEAVLEDHVLPACDETGLEPDEIVSILGKDLFMSTVWACAFEDMLTREFEDGSNIVDDYLKRRGWKETPSVRAYMAALRNSVVSLYEVSDVVLDRPEILRPPRLELIDFELAASDALFRAPLSELAELELLADALSAMRLKFGDEARG